MSETSTKSGSKTLLKYQQLLFELRERREQRRVVVVPLLIGCLESGIKQLTKDIKVLFKPEGCGRYIEQNTESSIMRK